MYPSLTFVTIKITYIREKVGLLNYDSNILWYTMQPFQEVTWLNIDHEIDENTTSAKHQIKVACIQQHKNNIHSCGGEENVILRI